MRDPERGDLEAGAAAVEREIRRLAPAAIPPGLRDRVMNRAAEARRGAALRPWMRAAAVSAAALILALLALDPVLARREEARLAAALDGRTAAPSVEEDAGVLAEAMGGAGGAKETARIARLEILAAAASRQEREQEMLDARRQLKGWLEHETPEDLE